MVHKPKHVGGGYNSAPGDPFWETKRLENLKKKELKKKKTLYKMGQATGRSCKKTNSGVLFGWGGTYRGQSPRGKKTTDAKVLGGGRMGGGEWFVTGAGRLRVGGGVTVIGNCLEASMRSYFRMRRGGGGPASNPGGGGWCIGGGGD